MEIVDRFRKFIGIGSGSGDEARSRAVSEQARRDDTARARFASAGATLTEEDFTWGKEKGATFVAPNCYIYVEPHGSGREEFVGSGCKAHEKKVAERTKKLNEPEEIKNSSVAATSGLLMTIPIPAGTMLGSQEVAQKSTPEPRPHSNTGAQVCIQTDGFHTSVSINGDTHFYTNKHEETPPTGAAKPHVIRSEVDGGQYAADGLKRGDLEKALPPAVMKRLQDIAHHGGTLVVQEVDSLSFPSTLSQGAKVEKKQRH